MERKNKSSKKWTWFAWWNMFYFRHAGVERHTQNKMTEFIWGKKGDACLCIVYLHASRCTNTWSKYYTQVLYPSENRMV